MATALVITMWAVVGVIVSAYYAYKTTESLIKKRSGYIRKIKTSKLYRMYTKKTEMKGGAR